MTTSKYTKFGYICYTSKLNSGFHNFSPNQVFLWLVEQGENCMKDQKIFLSVKKIGNNVTFKEMERKLYLS